MFNLSKITNYLRLFIGVLLFGFTLYFTCKVDGVNFDDIFVYIYIMLFILLGIISSFLLVLKFYCDEVHNIFSLDD